MRRPNTILTYTLFALYAGTMLFGQGLHSLSCSGHDAADLDARHSLDSGNSPGYEKSVESEHAAGLSNPHEHNTHGADCPICQFHGQGQLAAHAVELCVRPLAIAAADCRLEPRHLSATASSYSSRAPPRG